jgi:hypothetical protein
MADHSKRGARPRKCQRTDGTDKRAFKRHRAGSKAGVEGAIEPRFSV